MSADRAYRLWRQAGLQVPRRKVWRRAASGRPRPPPASAANQVWAYDFVFDRFANGQQLKCLTVVDEWTRECLAIEVAGFNDKFRDECLSLEWFRSRAEAKVLIEIWRRHYNEVRPHSSLEYLTPKEFINRSRSDHSGAIL